MLVADREGREPSEMAREGTLSLRKCQVFLRYMGKSVRHGINNNRAGPREHKEERTDGLGNQSLTKVHLRRLLSG